MLLAQPAPGAEASVTRTFHSGVNGRRAAENIANSIDLGDTYTTRAGRRSFRRVAGAWAVRQSAAGPASPASATNSTGILKNYSRARELSPKITLLKADPGTTEALKGSQELLHAEAIAFRTAQVDARPVLLDERSHLMMVPTGEIIVRLKDGASAVKVLGGEVSSQVKPSPAAREFILARSSRATEALFLEVDQLNRNPEVEWAEPNFLSEVVKYSVPNDPLVNTQWHLNNTGQGGGVAGADGKVFTAWDLTTGSSNIVIAIIDDGVQISHPDLAANIFTNRAETANGLDDDGNGFADDLFGWNFANNSTNVGPIDLNDADGSADFHGTSVAGVAAAVGNNNRSVAGVAYSSRILPVKVITGASFVDSVTMARAIRYAAGLNAAGVPNWRGADILSMSLGFPQSSEVDDALKDAAANGRGGKGCPIFAATGNGASGWYQYAVDIAAGSHTFKWVYKKDPSVTAGEDAVWLDEVAFPGTSTPERFEGATFPPPGWQTVGGTVAWTIDTSLNHAFGTGAKSARSGNIANSLSTGLQTTKTTTAGTFTFWMWVSSELDFDILTFSIDGVSKYMESGDPIVDSMVGYPAGNTNCIAVGASTDFDFRSDYSQYASSNNWNGVDFLAPSDGGASGIVTTDLAGTDGYNTTAGTAGDSTPSTGSGTFGGTSSATPFAAGVGALVLSVNTNLNAVQLRSVLRGACDKIGGVTYTNGYNYYFGFGRLNAYAAVRSQINFAPSLSTLTNQTIAEDTSLSLPFTVFDAETPAANLTVTPTSSNQTILPDAGLSVSGSGTNRTLLATPAPNGNGNVTVTLSVSDGAMTTNASFVLTISPVNDAPTLNVITNRSIHPGELLTLTAAASDIDIPSQSLAFDLLPIIPPGAAVNSSSGAFTWRPNAYQADSTNTIRLRVTDNGSPSLSATQTFLVAVAKLVPVRFEAPQIVADSLRVRSATDPGVTYTLQSSSSLTNWVSLLSTNAAGAFVDFVTPVPAGPTNQFFRVIVGP